MDWVSDLLLACALKKEAKALTKELKTDYPVLVTGLGTDRTLKTLEEAFDKRKPSLLLFSGMAGQLSPEINLGEFVFPAVWRFESGTEFRVMDALRDPLAERGWQIGGAGITVRKPVVRGAQRRRLHGETGALICDMECAAAMMIAETYGIPCLAPKVVSDTAESGMLAFYRHFGKNIETLGKRLQALIACLEEISTAG
jgi:nucleoside phosphorylase